MFARSSLKSAALRKGVILHAITTMQISVNEVAPFVELASYFV